MRRQIGKVQRCDNCGKTSRPPTCFYCGHEIYNDYFDTPVTEDNVRLHSVAGKIYPAIAGELQMWIGGTSWSTTAWMNALDGADNEWYGEGFQIVRGDSRGGTYTEQRCSKCKVYFRSTQERKYCSDCRRDEKRRDTTVHKCALDGCDVMLERSNKKYCSPAHRKKAHRKRA